MTEVSSVVPQSPDASSLLLTKRRCPFGESPRDMKLPVNSARDHTRRAALHYENTADDSGINETAFSILMQSQQQFIQTQQSLPSNVTFNKCWLCEKPSETMPCTFCEQRACEMCVRQCDKCFGVFCSCCATVKYDQHEDRALCLGCNSEEFKRRRAKAVPVHRVWRG